MQSNCRKPVFIVAFEYQHHTVAAADAGVSEHICHLVAVFFNIRKSEDVLFPFHVAPYERALVRGFLRCFIDNIVAEVKIVGIVKR